MDAWQVATVRVGLKDGWVRLWGDTGLASPPWDVACDNNGNIYAFGRFNGTLDFDPGPGIDEHTADGEYDFYLSKFSSDGVYHWVRTWGSPNDASDQEYPAHVTTDPSGNVLVAGTFFPAMRS